MEKHYEYAKDLFMMFVNYKQVCDSAYKGKTVGGAQRIWHRYENYQNYTTVQHIVK